MKQIDEFYLDNGLKVVMKNVPSSPVSSVYVWVKTGSAYENDSERGLAHVHEHMIFKGTSQLPVGEISKQIEFYGGDINAFTSNDETVYYATVSNNFVDKIINILSQCMYDALFDEEELKKELEVILEEIKRGDDSPSSKLWEMIAKSTFKGTDYSLPVIGTPKSVSSFTRQSLIDFYNKWYVSKNMTLIVIGGGNQSKIKEIIKSDFSKVKNTDLPSLNKKFDVIDSGIEIDIDTMDIGETYFSIYLKSPSSEDLSYAAFDILSSILGSGDSSILYKNIKEDKGLVTSISSANYTLRHSGVFYIFVTSNQDNIFDVIEIIFDNIISTLCGNYSDEQLQRVKTDVLVEDLYSNETVQSQAREIGNIISAHDDLLFKESYKKKILSLSKQDIFDSIVDSFKEKNFKFNIITPLKKTLSVPGTFVQNIKNKISKIKFSGSASNSYNGTNYTIKKIESDKVEISELSNGIKLITLQNTKTPLISLRSASLGGSSFETQDDNGKFSLLSDMFHRGSLKFSKDEIAIKSEILGAEISGYSGRNSIGLKLVSPSDHLNELLPIFSDMLSRPLFNENEFNIAKRDSLAYVDRMKKNSAAVASDKFHRLLFGNHPYSLNQYGTESSLNNISVKDVKDIHKKFFKTPNTILSAVGNFNKDELIEQLEDNIVLNNSTDIPQIDNNIVQISENLEEHFQIGDKQQSHIFVGTYAPSLNSKSRFSFNLINTVLSGMGGRLFIELRDKKSLAYSVASFYTPTINVGYFGAYIGCSPAKKDESIQAINFEINKLIKEGVTKEELDRAKNYLIGKNDISMQRNSSVNSRILLSYLYGLDINEPFNFMNQIENVDMNSINESIEEFLADAKFVTVSVDPN